MNDCQTTLCLTTQFIDSHMPFQSEYKMICKRLFFTCKSFLLFSIFTVKEYNDDSQDAIIANAPILQTKFFMLIPDSIMKVSRAIKVSLFIVVPENPSNS